MIRIEFKGDVEFIERIRSKGPRLVQVLTVKLNQLMAQLSNYIVSQKLSGQVLNRRTGILAGSVHPVLASQAGTDLVAAVESSAPPATYGRVHEYGGTRAYPIVATKARALAFLMDGKKVFARSVTHPPAKERSFMRSSLLDMKAEIESELLESLDEGLKE